MALDIDALLQDTADRHGLPSIVLGVSRHGTLLSTHAVGSTALVGGQLPDSGSVYRIASMTKSFTAAAVLLLRDRGLLRLDDEVVHYLPWFDDPRVSVRDLLTMNAGFPTDDPWGDRHEPTSLVAFDALVAAGVRRLRPARTGFEYSNLGYALLGRVVAVASGREYTEFVETELLMPLGMTATRFDHRALPAAQLAVGYAAGDTGLRPEPPVLPGAFSPMGGLHSSVRDLTVWIGGFLDAWSPRGTAHPLSAPSRLDQQQPHAFARLVLREEPTASASSLSYGYGLLAEEHTRLGRFIFHNGGYPGFGSQMRWHPSTGLAVVALTNRTYGAVYELAEQVLTELVALEPATDPGRDLWPETQQAMAVAEALLTRWDDDLADGHFAHNLDLDIPREVRRAAVTAASRALGAFARESSSVRSRTAAHARWQVRGEGGSAWLEVLMSPDREPRIQTLRVEFGDN